MTDVTDVGVVGAGAVGVTAAADLAERGAAVTVYERDEPGAGATGRAAGIVYDAYAERSDAELATRAVERFRESDAPFRETPYLFFAREDGSGADADAVREAAEQMRADGRAVDLVDPAALRREFPQVRSDDVAVAAIARTAGTVEPSAYVEATVERARRAGVRVETGAAATVATDPPRVRAGGEERDHDAVLVAAGAHTGPVLADAGLSVPLKPYRVQAVATTGPAVPVLYDATAGRYCRPSRRGLVAGGGADPVASDPDDWRREADDGFVTAAGEWLDGRLVNFEGRVDRSWAGLCVATPDRDPLLGPVAAGVYVAAGWHGHGFMLAPATGERVAEQILGGQGVDHFSPARFDGDEEFEIVTGVTAG